MRIGSRFRGEFITQSDGSLGSDTCWLTASTQPKKRRPGARPGVRQARQRCCGHGRGRVFRREVSRHHWTGDQVDGQATVGSVALNPVGGGGLAAGATDRPDVFEGVGEAPKNTQDGRRVGVPHPALVLPVRHIQGVMGAVLHAPPLLFQTQPLRLVELAGAARSDQPRTVQLPPSADPAIDPRDLERPGQAQFLGLNRPGDQRPILPATAPRSLLLHPRGERQPAGVAGLF